MILLAGLSLAACGKSMPTRADVAQAVNTILNGENGVNEKSSPRWRDFTLKDFSCAPTEGATVQDCEVEFAFGQGSQRGQVRLRKFSSSWKADNASF